MEERFSGFVDHKHPVYMEDLCFPRAMYKEDLRRKNSRVVDYYLYLRYEMEERIQEY